MIIFVCPRCGETEASSHGVSGFCGGVEMLSLNSQEIGEARRIVDKSRSKDQLEARLIGSDDKIRQAAYALAGFGGGHA